MEPKKIDINTLANFVIFYCLIQSVSINHLKLQKLLYYIQSWHLVHFDGHSLFDDEPEAWINGPVYRKVYDKWKKERGIYDEFVLKFSLVGKLGELFNQKKEAIEVSDSQWSYLESVLNRYVPYSHEKLVLMTHKDAPWNEAREGLEPFVYADRTITHSSMQEFYTKLLAAKNKRLKEENLNA